MTAAAKLQRPAVPIPAANPAAELDHYRAIRAAQAIATSCELGILEAGRELAELDRLLELAGDALHAGLEAASAGDAPGVAAAVNAWASLRARLRASVPITHGAFVKCRECGQVGEAVEVAGLRLRWRWPGRDELGELVHPFAVLVARRVGDAPPRLCPDHELEARQRKELPPARDGQVVEIDRRAVR